MSEPNTNANDFSFAGLTESEGLDINAIFGGTGTAADTNPFDVPPQKPPVPEVPAAPVQQEAQNTPATAPITAAPTVAPAVVPASSPDPQRAAPAEPAADAPMMGNLIEAAFQQQDEENTRKGLFEKLPVFSYGTAAEEITDSSMTFEELRIAKSDDFPELSEGKKVSWTVEYGKSVKFIADPKGTTIASVKEELERSKDFLNNLKKAKDKNPTCFVKPKVTAQSKGIASYKGVFASVEDARASDKTICLIPAKNGRVYELRKTELGEFIAPKDNVVEFSAVRAGFAPALPLIPRELLLKTIGFFRHFMENHTEFEALVHVYWDRENEEFVLYVPRQKVYKAHLDADLQADALPEDRYLHYVDIHSHNSMDAKFSHIDDMDEMATRLYIVIGRLEQYFPSVTARMSCGGVFQEIDLAEIAEPLNDGFPAEWLECVETGKTICRVPVLPGKDKLSSDTFTAKLLAESESFRYQLLGRMDKDCAYYLGWGGRQPSTLWAQDAASHISLMKEIWMSFPDDRKPEWLPYSKIKQYEAEMLCGEDSL